MPNSDENKQNCGKEETPGSILASMASEEISLANNVLKKAEKLNDCISDAGSMNDKALADAVNTLIKLNRETVRTVEEAMQKEMVYARKLKSALGALENENDGKQPGNPA